MEAKTIYANPRVIYGFTLEYDNLKVDYKMTDKGYFLKRYRYPSTNEITPNLVTRFQRVSKKEYMRILLETIDNEIN